MNPKIKSVASAVAVAPLFLLAVPVVLLIKLLEALRVIKIDKP
jgi:hypothetical protein